MRRRHEEAGAMLLSLAMLVLLVGLFGVCAGLVRFVDALLAPLD